MYHPQALEAKLSLDVQWMDENVESQARRPATVVSCEGLMDDGFRLRQWVISRISYLNIVFSSEPCY